MRGIRSRLALALVALVAVTVTAIGVGTYAFVDARLRDGLVAEATRQAQFNLSVLIPERLPDGVTREALEGDELADAFRLRGDVETIVDFGDGQLPYVSNTALLRTIDAIPATVRDLVGGGHLAFAWLAAAGHPALILGGRAASGTAASGPAFYFVFPAVAIEQAEEQLRLGLVVAAIVAILLALATARIVARGILRPVGSGSAAAARIAAGDLSARVPVGGADEFAGFALEFNRMADALSTTIASLEASERQNQQFVADVSHELRTPLTALVAEASIIEAGLAGLSPDGRRAAELLVADVRRLRVLVDDLMELSRFDAHAEQLDAATLEPVDLGAAVRAIVGSRLPTASFRVVGGPIVVTADLRRLDRIVGNLLDNARLHAPGTPVDVTVSVDSGQGHAPPAGEVLVADRGPGVPPEALPHLFDRFFKADASRTGSSSGLGLAIAAEHAALLGGRLVADNRPEGGLIVALRLPVTGSLPSSDATDTPEDEAAEASDASSASGQPARPKP